METGERKSVNMPAGGQESAADAAAGKAAAGAAAGGSGGESGKTRRRLGAHSKRGSAPAEKTPALRADTANAAAGQDLEGAAAGAEANTAMAASTGAEVADVMPSAGEAEELAGEEDSGKRKRHKWPTVVLILLLLMALCAIGYLLWDNYFRSDAAEGGAVIVPTEGMSEEEAQALIDELVEESKMTISVNPEPVLSDDGTLSVNVINDEDNSFDQMFELIQTDEDGEEQTLFTSTAFSPGEYVPEITVEGCEPGEAYIEVTAVKDGEKSGNPTRVAITIVSEEDAGDDEAGQE